MCESKIGTKVPLKKVDVTILSKFPSLLHTVNFSVLFTEFMDNTLFQVDIFSHFIP